MSSIFKPCNYSKRQQENNWMNITFAAHDQFCSCNDPWLHFLIVINKNSNAIKPETEIQNIKWLLTGKPTGEEEDNHTEEGGFFEGELETLFKEEDGEKEETSSGTR